MDDKSRLESGSVAEVSKSMSEMTVVVCDGVVCGGVGEMSESSDGIRWAGRAESNDGLDDRGSAYSIGFDFANPIGLKLRRQSTLSSILIENDGKRRKAPES